MKSRRSIALTGLALGSAALLFVGCAGEEGSEGAGGPPRTGQSGSEFSPPLEGEGGSLNSGDIRSCPCEQLAGVVPLIGEVVSWSSSILTLEVTAVPLDDPPAGVPVAGDVVRGIHYGWLPCRRGEYLPSPGDQVVGFLNMMKKPHPQCCAILACDDVCADQEAAAGQDECLAECQGPAHESCDEEFKEVEVLGEFTLSAVAKEGVLLGRTGEESVVASTDQLQLVFDGGSRCLDAFGEAQQRIQDAPGASFEGGLWKQSCEQEFLLD